jgi:uncharacterized protein
MSERIGGRPRRPTDHGDSVSALVVADTHLGDGQAHRLIDRLGSLLDEVDVILHAGDITHESVLHELARTAPVHAVLGNNDRGLTLPERFEQRIGGCRVAMVHDSGPSAGRGPRLLRWFPNADLVLFGHSHAPWHETVERSDGGVQHQVNPGSAMQRRGQPHCTAAMITWSLEGIEVRHVRLDTDGATAAARSTG